MRDFIITLLPQGFPKETIPTAVLNEIIYQQMLVVQLEHINTILPSYTASKTGTLSSTILMTTPNIMVGIVPLPSDILQIDDNIKSVVVAYTLNDFTGYMPKPATILEFNQFIKECADNYTTDYNNPIAASDGKNLYVSPYLEDVAPMYQLWYYRIATKPLDDNALVDIPAVYLGELGTRVVNYLMSLLTFNNQPAPAVEQALIYRQQSETTRSINDAITRP